MALLDFIIITGFAVTIFINIFLSKKKGQSNTFLMLIFSFIGLSLLNEYASLHDQDGLLYVTDLITEGGSYLLAPFIYFYISSLLHPVEVRSVGFISLFVPYVVHFLLVSLPVLHNGFGLDWMLGYAHVIEKNWELFYVVESLFFLMLVILAFQEIVKYEARIKAFYSDLSRRNLIWAKQMLACLVIYQVINLSLSAYILLIAPLNFEEDYLLTFNVVIICFYLGYNGLFQTQIFLPNFLLEEEKIESSSIAEASKAKKTPVENEVLSDKIEHSLKVEKLYLNEDLTLRDLAEAVALKEKDLSIYINQHLGSSFYELINSYRVQEFKEQIKTNTHLTVMGVANSCGFKSKTSFYRIFKKATGLTPAQYQKEVSE
ncbi:MAG: helix-turn-helix domain-containing protein [Chitinophagales bacterium]|nr:helix-turn-helix domain-containing protein [Chitinophagales bacterium]